MIGGEREREMKKNTIADKEEKLRGNVGGENEEEDVKGVEVRVNDGR